MKNAIISSGYDLNELLVYKCEGCNTIVCTRPLTDPMYIKGSKAFKFLTLDHIRTCKHPEIIVHGSTQEYVHLSQELITKLQSKVGLYDKTYQQVLERSLYNSACELTKEEYQTHVKENHQRILDEVAKRERLQKIGEKK